MRRSSSSGGTPFISLLEPHPLTGWDRTLPADEQPDLDSLPRTFVDAMRVRQEVFVQEQNVPLANEFDADDPRSCHWVIYASVNKTVEPARTDPVTGKIIQPRRSETQSVPIGTIRLVPFPHPPHPLDGGVYVDGELVNSGEPVARVHSIHPAAGGERTTSQYSSNSTSPTLPNSQIVPPAPPSLIKPAFTPDRPTTYHDGVEPYLKLGRLAVIPAFRGRGIAQQLIKTAVAWARSHPEYFNPSATEQGFEQLGMEEGSRMRGGGVVPRWQGLICVHAQVDAIKVWERCGFVLDEGMGKWMEEGIPHVGMFLRVSLDKREDEFTI